MVLAAWLYLLAGRGGFWLAAERDSGPVSLSGALPPLAIVVPARDEAEHIGQTVTSLLSQDYRGEVTLIVVDDQSRDGTAEVARVAAAKLMRRRPS